MATVEARIVGKFYNALPSVSVLDGFTDVLIADPITATAGDDHDFENLYARRRVDGAWQAVTLPASFYYLNKRDTNYLLYKIEKRTGVDKWDRKNPSDSVGYVVDYTTGRQYRRVGNVTTVNDEQSRVAFEFAGYVPAANASGHLVLTQPGAHISIASGAVTDSVGTVTLNGDTPVVVANTNVRTGDLIILTRVSTPVGDTPGHVTYTIQDGVSFTVVSSEASDQGVLNYLIIRPYSA